jgi:hypothetical protein
VDHEGAGRHVAEAARAPVDGHRRQAEDQVEGADQVAHQQRPGARASAAVGDDPQPDHVLAGRLPLHDDLEHREVAPLDEERAQDEDRPEPPLREREEAHGGESGGPPDAEQGEQQEVVDEPCQRTAADAGDRQLEGDVVEPEDLRAGGDVEGLRAHGRLV